MSNPAAQRDDHAAWAQLGTSLANGDIDWDSFDSDAYFDHNYGTLRDDDRRIIRIVTDFFQEQQRFQPWRPRAIDVGAGANLYPALTMLPFTAEITLYERATSNCDWLRHQRADPSPSWWQFWAEMELGRSAYHEIKKPLDLLSRRARVVKGNIFNLPSAAYDIGTMFFVAESITTQEVEFRRAVGRFIGSLRRQAPFAAAFMKDSSGYRVGGVNFPACSVDEQDIDQILSKLALDVTITSVDSNDLRDGYGGMIVATGRKRA